MHFYRKTAVKLLAEHFYQHEAESFRFIDVKPGREAVAIILYGERYLLVNFAGAHGPVEL